MDTITSNLKDQLAVSHAQKKDAEIALVCLAKLLTQGSATLPASLHQDNDILALKKEVAYVQEEKEQLKAQLGKLQARISSFEKPVQHGLAPHQNVTAWKPKPLGNLIDLEHSGDAATIKKMDIQAICNQPVKKFNGKDLEEGEIDTSTKANGATAVFPFSGEPTYNHRFNRGPKPDSSSSQSSTVVSAGSNSPTLSDNEAGDSSNLSGSFSSIEHAETSKPDLPSSETAIWYTPAEDDLNTLRTVHVSNIPAEASLTDVVSCVHSGIIIDIKLLDTTKLLGSTSALVTFHTQASAIAFIKSSQTDPITLKGEKLVLSLIGSPTHPLHPRLRIATAEGGQTRCIEIRSFQSLEFTKLCYSQFLSWRYPTLALDKWNPIVYKDFDTINETLTLHFTSVRVALDAVQHFIRRGCAVKCVPDPCAVTKEHEIETEND